MYIPDSFDPERLRRESMSLQTTAQNYLESRERAGRWVAEAISEDDTWGIQVYGAAIGGLVLLTVSGTKFEWAAQRNPDVLLPQVRREMKLDEQARYVLGQ